MKLKLEVKWLNVNAPMSKGLESVWDGIHTPTSYDTLKQNELQVLLIFASPIV